MERVPPAGRAASRARRARLRLPRPRPGPLPRLALGRQRLRRPRARGREADLPREERRRAAAPVPAARRPGGSGRAASGAPPLPRLRSVAGDPGARGRRPLAPARGRRRPGRRSGRGARAARTPSRRASWPSSPRRPATPRRCSPSTSTSRPTSASTRSSRPSSSAPCARSGGFRATTAASCATTRRSRHVIGFVHDGPPRPREGAGAPSRRRAPLPAPPWPPPLPPRPLRRAPAADPVLARVLAIVTEKTGYPAEMLDPDLDLEADLGVDTVKQAELFTTCARSGGSRATTAASCATTRRSRHVVQLRLRQPARPAAAGRRCRCRPRRRPASGRGRPAAPAPRRRPWLRRRPRPTRSSCASWPSSPRRRATRPRCSIPELDLEADLGVDTVKQAELFTTVREEWGIPRDDSRKLREYPTLRHVVGFVYDNRPDLATAGGGAPRAASALAASRSGPPPRLRAAGRRRLPAPVRRGRRSWRASWPS